MTALSAGVCSRLYGGSVRECACLLPDEAGFLECPPEARGILGRVPEPEPIQAARPPAPMPSYSGDICRTCGSGYMVRTGTCLTCQSCGDSSGGCS